METSEEKKEKERYIEVKFIHSFYFFSSEEMDWRPLT